MRYASVLLVSCVVLVSFVFTAQAQDTGLSTKPMVLVGEVQNVTVGVEGDVTMTLTQTQGVYTVRGKFGKQLVGMFNLPGRKLEGCAKGHTCLLFSGSIDLGGVGGWPQGTQTTFVMTLNILPGGTNAKGVYHIGSLSGFDSQQYGVLELRKQRTKQYRQ